MNDTMLLATVAAATLLPVTRYVLKYRSANRRAKQTLDESVASGTIEPVSLHPDLDPNRCISIGACADACPEGEVLGVVGGKAELIAPSKCIGHGACMAACPVDAITLVFGTATRGVEIPHVHETFETNVSGIYIAGELGGMGLIRNAVTQGKQAIGNIASRPLSRDPSIYDVAIVGAGPAGLAATLQAEKEGLKYLTIDQEDIGGTILSYPRQKLVMTQPMDIPIYGKFDEREIQKEDLLQLWHDVVQKTGVRINTHERLEDIIKPNGHFELATTAGRYTAKHILLAIGRRGTPRKLGVPGEESSRVTYKLLEPEQYRRKKLLVVGGGDSAVEAAVSLSEQPGTQVTLSYRKNAFSRIKAGNRDRINEAIENECVRVLFESNVVAIGNESVSIEHKGRQSTLRNDYTFVFIGGELPTPFLRKLGIQIDTKFGER
jgi:thioredoxin reductase (NADPH)